MTFGLFLLMCNLNKLKIILKGIGGYYRGIKFWDPFYRWGLFTENQKIYTDWPIYGCCVHYPQSFHLLWWGGRKSMCNLFFYLCTLVAVFITYEGSASCLVAQHSDSASLHCCLDPWCQLFMDSPLPLNKYTTIKKRTRVTGSNLALPFQMSPTAGLKTLCFFYV